MRRLLYAGLAVLALARPATAQILDSGSITAGGADCTTAARCTVFAMPPATAVTLAVSGTFSATLQFEASSDGGTTWFSVLAFKLADGSSATSTTATGQYSVPNAGITHLRVRCSSYSSGTATVTAARGYAIAKWLTPFLTTGYFGDGSGGAPSISFASATNTGLFNAGTTNVFVSSNGTTAAGFINNTGKGLQLLDTLPLSWAAAVNGSSHTALAYGGAAGKVTLTGTTPMIQIGGTSSSFPALKQSGSALAVRLADDSGDASLTMATATAVSAINNGTTGFRLVGMGAPTISSGFGTSPSIASNNGTGSFTVNVGTGGVATSGVIGLPAASNGWNCFVSDQTTNVATRQTASTTTTATVTAASAWTASDILIVSCFGR